MITTTICVRANNENVEAFFTFKNAEESKRFKLHIKEKFGMIYTHNTYEEAVNYLTKIGREFERIYRGVEAIEFIQMA